MIDLTNLEEIKKLDPKDVYGSTGMFVAQCRQISEAYFGKEFFSDDYKKIKNIVVCGMGGSAYGGHIAQTLFEKEIKVPVIVNSNYHLPGFADSDTLVILASYSGSTEEVLSCGNDAKSKGIKIAGFTSGGKLGEFLKDKYPCFVFDAKHNPSGQPRLGTGYMVVSMITLLSSLGVVSVTSDDLKKAIDEVENSQVEIKKLSMDMAKNLQGQIPIIFAAQHLVGNSHIIRNQFNETSKSFSAYEDLPELNHHLMEGLKNPGDKKLHVIFLSSGLYSDLLKKRVSLTQDVVDKNNIEWSEYKPTGSSKLAQVLQTLSFGGYLTLYLALLYGQDPSVIPWVDYFKKQLAS